MRDMQWSFCAGLLTNLTKVSDLVSVLWDMQPDLVGLCCPYQYLVVYLWDTVLICLGACVW